MKAEKIRKLRLQVLLKRNAKCNPITKEQEKKLLDHLNKIDPMHLKYNFIRSELCV